MNMNIQTTALIMVDVYSVVNIQRKSLKCVYIQLRNYTVNRLEYFPSDTLGEKNMRILNISVISSLESYVLGNSLLLIWDLKL